MGEVHHLFPDTKGNQNFVLKNSDSCLPIDPSLLSAINFHARYNGLNWDYAPGRYYGLLLSSILESKELFQLGILKGLDSELEWELYRSEPESFVGVPYGLLFSDFDSVLQTLNKEYASENILGFLMNYHVQGFIDFLSGKKTPFKFEELNYTRAFANQKGDFELVKDLDEIATRTSLGEKFTFVAPDFEKEYRIDFF